MLFNSPIFIYVFLPVTLTGFFLFARRVGHRGAIGWLVAASFFFYGWWNPSYLGLIGLSIGFNYLLGRTIRERARTERLRRTLLILGVSSNLALLGYYKYAGFITDNLSRLFGWDVTVGEIVLPLAISFFTFQQVAYLVDTYHGKTEGYDFLHYCLFVTFFPQLIAGPIVLYQSMLPQFADRSVLRVRAENWSVGLSMFSYGLAKKVILADGVSPYAVRVFWAADHGLDLTLLEAWGGVLAYTFQIYFDFSGYSDMALGLGRLFGIRLPSNFYSPYKAESIIEFWRRWHITLSHFLRDYLYIPLGGNRRGKIRRYVNLLLTMLLGGLWHGAGWNFVIWGGLHGAYLVVNHAWRRMRSVDDPERIDSSLVRRVGYRALTFMAVVFAWTFFRAETFGGALSLLHAMFGGNGLYAGVPYDPLAPQLYTLVSENIFAAPAEAALWLGALFAISQFLPNTLQLFYRYTPVCDELRVSPPYGPLRYGWEPSLSWALWTGALLLACLLLLTSASEFLYFQF